MIKKEWFKKEWYKKYLITNIILTVLGVILIIAFPSDLLWILAGVMCISAGFPFDFLIFYLLEGE